MSVRDNDKASRYIVALDTARSNGNWAEFPELIRKVTKHAPQKKCLIQTANAEYEVARYISKSAADSKTATGPSTPPDVSRLIPSLLSLIDPEPTFSEEVFQAQICLAWTHWALREPGLAASTLTKDLSTTWKDLNNGGKQLFIWTEICFLKALYMKGTAQGMMGNVEEALSILESGLAWLDQSRMSSGSSQLHYWEEQMLAQLGKFASKNFGVEESGKPERTNLALNAFQRWSALTRKGREISPTTFGNTYSHLSRLAVLDAYYGFLSRLLQSGQGYPGGKDQRQKQCTELRNVQRMYENELLRVSRFPKANESNHFMEQWVEQVIHNWEILCGSSWLEGDLGEGGRNSVGRDVLDILYRAATKTFHSTLILRRLFQVHKSLTDFDLAFKAFDTYIELIDRGTAWAEKSKTTPTGQDDEETVMRTISEAIDCLCSFGRRGEAEKAYNLAIKLENLMEEHVVPNADNNMINGFKDHTKPEQQEAPKITVNPPTTESVYRAMGIAKAQWAKWTPASEDRSLLQAEAVANLKEAVSQATGNIPPLDSLYALSVLLAETRDINKSIEFVKKGLALDWPRPELENFFTERKLLPFWHLLALLLTSRQEFDTASQACQAAFDQFHSAKARRGSGKRHLGAEPSAENHIRGFSNEPGLTGDMEYQELERILEIQVTRLALVELSEGPEEAVNNAPDLLSLFSQLFGRFGLANDIRTTKRTEEPPKSSASTVKSFRGSLFGRKKHIPQHMADSIRVQDVSNVPKTDTPPTRASQAPAILVTDETNTTQATKTSLLNFHKQPHREDQRGQRLHRKEGSITRIIRQHSQERKKRQDQIRTSNEKKSFDTSHDKSTQPDAGGHTRPSSDGLGTKDSGDQHIFTQSGPPGAPPNDVHNSSPKAKQPLPEIGHNLPHDKLPPPPGHADQPPEQDLRLPTLGRHSSSTTPRSRFPNAASEKYALSVLVKTWLLIAGLYRKAYMFDDSREACIEAEKAATLIENLIADQESSARAFADAGWGGGKSSDEVFADVLCERAALAMARGEVENAADFYEQALLRLPDHPGAVVGLSNILLDMYEQKMPTGSPSPMTELSQTTTKQDVAKKSRTSVESTRATLQRQNSSVITGRGTSAAPVGKGTDEDIKKTPENLNRLAARDRAYGLLSNLTKLGNGCDDSEAWFTLARAHELGGQVEKAKEVLWWCVELEDRRPIRHWRNVGGGYIL